MIRRIFVSLLISTFLTTFLLVPFAIGLLGIVPHIYAIVITFVLCFMWLFFFIFDDEKPDKE